MWRLLRITVLSLTLFAVAALTWVDRERTTDWDNTLWIGIFPINADGRPETARYIAGLERSRLGAIEGFFAREARRHGIALERPVHVELFPEVRQLPPRLPADAGPLQSIAWSLAMRYYTWKHAGGTLADIRVFVLYHDPGRTLAVPHSLGLQKGLMGVVYAYAERRMDGMNSIVIAHEVMHTLGATDKYDPGTNLPRFPDGYARPDAPRRHPQAAAELMAGRRPLSETEAEMPDSLRDVVVGDRTAAEIRWLTPPR